MNDSSVTYQAIWKGVVLAESNQTITLEGNQYFPPEAVNREFFRESKHQTTCPWKGLAHYYTVEVDGERNANAAWYYPTPSPAAREITDHVAFWQGVEVVTAPAGAGQPA